MKPLLLATSIILGVVSIGAFAHGEKPHAQKFSAAQLSEEKAFGKAGDPKQIMRTIRIDGHDNMRYTPSEIRVKQGETIRLVVANKGNLMHEAVLGTRRELGDHYELMKKFPAMEHDEPHMVHLKPGRTGEMVWQFTKAGEFYFACLMPGHYEAGMMGKIIVSAR